MGRGRGVRPPRRPCALRGHPAPLLPTLGRQTSLCRLGKICPGPMESSWSLAKDGDAFLSQRLVGREESQSTTKMK